MPRKKRKLKREKVVDLKHGSFLLAKIISGVLQKGKKSLAENIVYTAIDIAGQKTKKDGVEVFEKAIQNIQPILEVKSRRVGGATYQVPVEVKPKRKLALAIRWLVNYSKLRSEKTMAEKLAGEVVAAFNNEGAAIKKREDTHRMAEANKAFAHFRW